MPTSDRQSGGGLVPMLEPAFSGNEWTHLRECLDSTWVSAAGPFVGRFERAVADYVGAAHAIATVTGSAALHLALRLVGVEPDDEVLVPDLTFIAPTHAVRQCGAHPVLIDADPDSWQIDASLLAAFLTEDCVTRADCVMNVRSGRRVRAVLPVHLLGVPCEIERVVEIARRHRLAVVEDAAQAMGARHRGRHVGTFGDVGVLSFNGNKVVTAGGGGMLLAADERRYELALRMAGQGSDDGELAYNCRLSSMQAALGLAQLERIDTLLDQKRRVAARYAAALDPIEGVVPMRVPADARPSFWLNAVRLAGASAEQRDGVVRRMAEHGIEARPLWRPMHDLAANCRCSARGGAVAARLWAESIALPSSANLAVRDQERTIAVLLDGLRSLKTRG